MFKNMKNKKVLKIGITVIIVYLLVLIVVYIDVILRARSAYLMGEKYWRWHFNPELKKNYLEEERKKKLEKLEEKFRKGKIDKIEYEDEKMLIEEEFRWKMNESSIKNAYMWYKTVVDLFQPPKSKYVKLSEVKMKKALQLWKEELKRKGIKFEEYMLTGE
ncbi:MAG: hypothetical protein DRI36_06020 [Caldiserica bacterium]|mgnify:CR=1 FL=1|nr:MAG: hypothetical protein DRI36_06020 [Caldisericota bacterium]